MRKYTADGILSGIIFCVEIFIFLNCLMWSMTATEENMMQMNEKVAVWGIAILLLSFLGTYLSSVNLKTTTKRISDRYKKELKKMQGFEYFKGWFRIVSKTGTLSAMIGFIVHTIIMIVCLGIYVAGWISQL